MPTVPMTDEELARMNAAIEGGCGLLHGESICLLAEVDRLRALLGEAERDNLDGLRALASYPCDGPHCEPGNRCIPCKCSAALGADAPKRAARPVPLIPDDAATVCAVALAIYNAEEFPLVTGGGKAEETLAPNPASTPKAAAAAEKAET